MAPSQVEQNKRRSHLLLAASFGVVAAFVWAVAALLGLGWAGLALGLGVAAATSAASWWGSEGLALRVSRAQPADPAAYPRLHNVVEGLCSASGLPKPQVYVIDDAAPNAFAAGRSPDHASIAVTTGLLEMMSRVELEAVLAHELSHIKNDDIMVTTLAVTCVGAVAVLSDVTIRFLWWNGGRRGRADRDRSGGPLVLVAAVGFALLIASPLISRLLRVSVSRRREDRADVSAVRMTRYPPALVSALSKLRDDTTVVHASSRATAHLWIGSPIALVESEGRLARVNRLFDTHPPIDDRIAALQEL